MTEQNRITWHDAFMKQPGPVSIKEALTLSLKGVCMGAADIVPGVSGGTVALITGIYQNLLNAIRSADSEFIRHLLHLDMRQALSVLHIRFLISLLAGIGLSIISLSRLMNYLLRIHPVPTWSLFWGLIAASIFIIGKRIQRWRGTGGAAFIAGAAASYGIVGMIPISTPEAHWFIFLSGMIAICAMILPGLSGAFLLLLLGKYEYITGALKNPFDTSNLLIIIIFSAGCCMGIVGFSRLLSYLLRHYYNATLAMLTGLMLGSMRKIWPWKEVLESRIVHGKMYILREQNVWPSHFDGMFFLACALALGGLFLIFGLEKLAQRK